ncbi:S-layer homology domain-containing protein [Clostridium aminobutyricum]|uniref:S-layer homology domain-containing protein n=1 Tax=Clostridium aminobutyricum TaxID=33953 RepID=A0A939D9L3_CLOAM|nr:S-layer homology domain-containing protein [Clostridium aminobutyricum]MBN7773732.1 S-layer homology domain-containing protein [Clostridium aminobutyricum]
MRKLCAILLCSVFVCMGGVLSTENCYAAHWADQYLNNLVSQGIMRGDDDGNLYPDNSITRAEFVAMMNRAFGYRQTGNIAFNDVPADAWYYDDIRTAYNQGYFNGIYPDTAGPNVYLKREQAVAMLFRALKIEGNNGDSMKFSDSKAFSSWSKDYINTAVEKDFLSGYPDQTFRPADYMTRGEMAKVLSKVSGEIVKHSGDNYIGYASGNVSVIESGADLSNTTVPGDMYITAGIGTGYTVLDNVTVGGDLIISGTGNSEKGEISVILTDCDINRLVIDCSGKNIMSVRAEGSSVITDTIVKSNAYLEEASSKRNSAFRNVTLKGPKDVKLSLSGDFEEVTVKNPNNKLSLDKGSIQTLTIDEDAQKGTVYLEKNTFVESMFCDTATTVTGTGEIENIVINADGSNISMLPEKIYIRPGVTATINGKVMTSLEAEANSEDPEFIGDYPKYDELTATSVNLYAMTNKPGKVYWAIKNVDLEDKGMTYSEVKKPDSKEVVKSGNVNVMTEKEVTIKVSGLKSGVNYEYYMVFEDLKGGRTKVASDDFQTIDTVIPTFLNSTPRITASNESSFTMTVIPSKDVMVYWAVLPTKSISPTVETLVKQNVSGAVAKGTVSGCSMNETKDILMTATTTGAITEKTTYDIYLVAQDQKGNLSKLSKVIGTTLDTTPPKFMEGYPWAEPSIATALKIRYMGNEEGTLYWAAYALDAVFPPVDNPDTLTGSALKTAQVRAITTGQKALKSGKVNIKENTEGTLNISGLSKQTPYDIYFVIMDKSGNYSAVTSLLNLKTLDNLAPTASMKFEKVVDSKPTIDSDIKIVFDEIVYYDSPSGTDVRLRDATADQLKKMFILHDKLITTGVSDAVADGYVSYAAVAVAEENGKTVVTFSPECFNNGKGLNNGGTYQFELNNIVDSDGNAMNQKTLLSIFHISPPLVFMTDYDGTLASDEIGFTINPDIPINSDMYFDLVLQPNQQLRFTLYEDGSDLGTYTIQAGKARMIRLLQSATAPSFKKFDQITTTNFKLKILSINGVTDSNSWDASVLLNVKAVIGKAADLRNLGNGLDASSDPLGKVASNSSTIVVSNPSTLAITKVYTDAVNPQFVNGTPNFEIYDTAVEMTVMSDKPATLYYVMAKAGSISGTPTPDQIIAGLPSPIGSTSGNYSLAMGNKAYTVTINDLQANTDYVLYYVLKAKSLDNLTVYKEEPIRTQAYLKPHFIQTPAPTTKRTESSVEFKAELDLNSKVYWALYPYGARTTMSAIDIMEVGNNPNDVACYGQTTAKANMEFTINAIEMKPTRSYTLFMVAQSEYGKVLSDIQVFEPVRSQDNKAPKIESASTAAELSESSTGSAIRYKGSVTVLFSEGLYYSLVEGGTANALTDQKFRDLISIPSGVTSTLKTTTTEDVKDGSDPIVLFTIDFDGIKDGDSIIFPGHIYDKSVNYAGQLIMVFKASEDKTTGAFDVKFGTIN